ncbi:hypothetical protein ABIU59_004537 [Salmonella enterica subsp. enterica serovar Newport]
MPPAGSVSLHAAGVHADNQTLDLWINLKVTFFHSRIFPDKTGMVADEHVLFHAELKPGKMKNKDFTGRGCIAQYRTSMNHK